MTLNCEKNLACPQTYRTDVLGNRQTGRAFKLANRKHETN